MKKLFSLLTLALLTMSAWAQSPVTLDFTTNDWGLPTDYTTGPETYTNGDGYTITLQATNGYKFGGSYLIMGKKGTSLSLPAFSYPVKKIKVTGNTGASASVVQNIYVDTVAVSTATTGATGVNTYAIDENYQTAGTIYTLKVTSAHNTQITKIEILFEDEPEPVIPEVATLAVANALDDATQFKFTGDAVVTYHNGKYMFVRDNSGYGHIYYATAPASNMDNGTVLSQNWTATKTTYNGLVEYTGPADVSASGVTNTTLAVPQEISALSNDMINAYVKINHVKKISGTTATLTDGTTITLYNRFSGITIPQFEDQDCYITGIVSIYNNNLQLYFIESNYQPPVADEKTFVLVTDAADLAAGDEIILVNNEVSVAMGASKGNNFDQVAVTINNGSIVTNQANVITLEAANNGNWNLKTSAGYLYAASSSSNNMKLEDEVDANGNANAAITINDEATIVFQGPNTRNHVRYNQSSSIFSCYAEENNQKPVHIYKATEGVIPEPEITTLAQANALADNTNFEFKGNAVVTYQNGNYTFLRDDSGYGLIFKGNNDPEVPTFQQGVVLSQGWTATKTTYRTLVEYTGATNLSASGQTNAAYAVPQVIAVADMANMINAYVKIEHVKSISGTTATLTDGTTITLFNRFNLDIPVFDNADATITGIVSIYNNNLQLYFISSEGAEDMPTAVNDLAEANNLADGTKFAYPNDVAATYQHGNYLFIRDENGNSGLIFGAVGATFETGDVLGADWTATKTTYHGAPQFANPNGVTNSGDTWTVEPNEHETLTADNVHEYVIVKGQTITACTDTTNQYMAKTFYNGDGMVLFNQFDVDMSGIEEGKTYDVVGIANLRDGEVQMYIISVTEAAAGLRGDVDNSGNVDISDATALINYLLYGNSEGLNMDNANCDLTGGIDITDATTLINYLLYGSW